jgi:hypothetical protein
MLARRRNLHRDEVTATLAPLRTAPAAEKGGCQSQFQHAEPNKVVMHHDGSEMALHAEGIHSSSAGAVPRREADGKTWLSRPC